jgi:hypothetical protein
MGAPAVPHPDATCELRLPPTSYPKSKIKVLLLENIAGTAVEMFKEERFQVVGAPLCAICSMQACPVLMSWAMHTPQEYSMARVPAQPLGWRMAWHALGAAIPKDSKFDGVLQKTVAGALSPEELAEKIRDVHVLGIRSKMQVRGGSSAMPKLLWRCAREQQGCIVRETEAQRIPTRWHTAAEGACCVCALLRQVRDDALKHAKKLLAIGCFCIGTNQVDLAVRTPLFAFLQSGISNKHSMLRF